LDPAGNVHLFDLSVTRPRPDAYHVTAHCPVRSFLERFGGGGSRSFQAILRHW
jgi:hypothetical protein